MIGPQQRIGPTLNERFTRAGAPVTVGFARDHQRLPVWPFVPRAKAWPFVVIAGNLARTVPTLDDDLWALAMKQAAADPAPTNLVRDLLWRSLHLSGWRPRAPQDTDGPMTAGSDRSLLERFVHGDPEAFEILVERHGGALGRFARRSLSDEYADDAVQEAFLALFTKAHEVIASADRNVRGFLYGITRLRVVESLGHRLRDEAPLDELVAALPPPGSDALETLRAYESTELATLLLEACDTLEQRAVLMRLDGRDPAEVAAALELEPGHVRVLEHRAGTKLAALRERGRQ